MPDMPAAVFDPKPVQTYRINNAYQLTGIRSTDTSPQRVTVAELCRDCGITSSAESFLIQFRWERNIEYLSLDAVWAPLTTAVPQPQSASHFLDNDDEDELQPRTTASSVNKPQSFVSTKADVVAAYAQVVTRDGGSDRVWTEDLAKYQVRTAVVPRNAELNLDWRVDTETPAFLRCEELISEGIIDLNEPNNVKVVQLKVDRRRRDVPHNRIHIYGSLQIHWRETLAGKGALEGPYKRIEKRILIEVVPGLPLARYDGYAAIDFGNTNSTFACMSADSVGSTRVVFVPCESTVSATDFVQPEHSLNSAVRLKEFRPGAKRDFIAEARWTIGKDAIVESSGQLLLGGKRLLADPRREEGFPVTLSSGEVHIPKDLPAELLLTSMFRGFFCNQFSFPQPIGVTYPTTFSDAEIERTREAVFRALRRSGKVKTYLPLLRPTPDNPTGAHSAASYAKLLDDHVPRNRMLDEATAAAFYFVYRDFIRGPGRMPAAYFEYPQGINLLLYDCGGGTTDVALIHCRIYLEKKFPTQAGAVSSAGAVANELPNTWRVSIKVLGRTGHRDFGGDDITVAAFKVLKATLAQSLSEHAQKALNWNSVVDDQVEQWLHDNYDHLHQFVPTNWIRSTDKADSKAQVKLKLPPDELKLRQQTTLEFWQWAEKVKVAISKEGADQRSQDPHGVDQKSPNPFAPEADLSRSLVTLICRNRPQHQSPLDPAVIKEAIEKSYQDKELIRRRIDAMIQREVQRTIDATNAMIGGRLQEATRLNAAGLARNMELPQDSVVHWVYVVGKASHYPTIREALAGGLNVQNLQPPDVNGGTKQADIGPRASRAGRLRFEREVLKSCVAGGAALAMATAVGFADIKLVFDHELSQRLPYTVGYESADGKKVLYQENLRYSELTFREIPVAEQQTEKPIIWLYRQWPGQESYAQQQSDLGQWEQFMRFDFQKPPVGPIKVEFGPETIGASEGASRRKTFIMTDTNGKRERVVGKEVAERTYVSPPQRGDL